MSPSATDLSNFSIFFSKRETEAGFGLETVNGEKLWKMGADAGRSIFSFKLSEFEL